MISVCFLFFFLCLLFSPCLQFSTNESIVLAPRQGKTGQELAHISWACLILCEVHVGVIILIH